MPQVAALERLGDELDELVDATPPDRDRTIDLLRVASIGVVIVWHWALSLTHWEGGGLVMPNPIDVIPGAWLATWVLQIMPVFFLVGGYVNLRGWRSIRRRGGAAWQFLGPRLWRLAVPPAVFAVTWGLFEGLLLLLRDGHRTALDWGGIVFMPFWFLGAYTFVVLLVPLTARWHDRARLGSFVVLGAGIAASDLLRFVGGVEVFGIVTSGLVWLTVHQLGYLLADGTLDRLELRGRLALTGAALVGLAMLTGLLVYPGSMVATRDVELSNMWPTTAPIALVGLLQLGLVLLVRPAAARWLERRRPWKAVVAVNTVIMTLFVWHMAAKVAVIGIYEALGFEPIAEATLAWWLQRPVWLIAPAMILAVLVAIFAPFELWSRRR